MYNGLGRYEEAKLAALQATMNTLDPSVTTFALPELIEAAARGGTTSLPATRWTDWRRQHSPRAPSSRLASRPAAARS